MSGPARLHPRRGAWRVALRYAWRDARRHKGRTALVALMVALPSGLGAAIAVVAVSTLPSPGSLVMSRLGPDADVQALLDLQGPGRAVQDVRLSSYGAQPTNELVPPFEAADDADPSDWANVLPVDAAAYERALAATMPSADRLVAVGSLWDVTVSAPGAPGPHATARVRQVDDPSGPVAAALGLDAPLGPGQVALDATVARSLHVGVGDEVDLGLPEGADAISYYLGGGSYEVQDAAGSRPAGTFTVAEVSARTDGVVAGPDGPLVAPRQYDFWRDHTGDAPAVTVQWLVVGPDPVTWDHVEDANRLGATAFSRVVVLDPPAEAIAAAERDLGSGSTPVSAEAASIVGGAVVLGLLQAILMIGPAFQVGARRAARDLALLAANGADARTVRRTVLAGALVVGVTTSVAATAAGATLAAAALHAWSTQLVVVPWPWLVAFAAVGTLIALGAAWLPARRASRVDPVLVLAGRRADPAPKRLSGVVGAVLAVVGVMVALVGAATHRPVTVLVAGIVLAEVGLVVASGSIVGGLARVARSLRGTSRLALRDAARHRARTAPAVAAVLAATAAAVAGLVLASSQSRHDRLSYVPDAATGTFLVGPLGDPSQEVDGARRDTMARVVEDAGVVDGALLPVTSVRTDDSSDTPVWVAPVGTEHPEWTSWPSAVGTVVDDGSDERRLALLGVPEPSTSAAALRQGRVLVAPQYLAADGTAEVVVSHGDDSRTYHLPATAVGDGLRATNLPILPPSVAHDLGLRTGTAALVGRARGAWDDAIRTTLDERLHAAIPQETASDGYTTAAASAYVEPGASPWDDGPLLAEALITGGALLVALAAAWIATALAGTESLPDLATLRAIGAPPRTRRRFAAAQSLVITVTGAVLGAATGLVIGAVVVLAQRERGGTVDRTWMIDVPWPWVGALLVAVPLLGAAAAWLVTRSRLPMTRRLDG